MPELHLLPTVVAVVVAFLLSTLWYASLGSRLAALHPAYATRRTTPLIPLVELARNLVLTVVVSTLAGLIGVTGAGPALGLGLLLWIGFPVVLLSGSMLHERVPVALAAIHAGDWLLKLVAISLVVSLVR